MAGYALAKKRFVGRQLLFTLIVCAMALPKQVILIPLLREMSALNLYNTIWQVSRELRPSSSPSSAGHSVCS